MDSVQILSRIQTLLPDAQVWADGKDCSFNLKVVSQGFEGLSRLERQKRILGLFQADLARGDLHALSVQAHTPEEWQIQQGQGLVSLG